MPYYQVVFVLLRQNTNPSPSALSTCICYAINNPLYASSFITKPLSKPNQVQQGSYWKGSGVWINFCLQITNTCINHNHNDIKSYNGYSKLSDTLEVYLLDSPHASLGLVPSDDDVGNVVDGDQIDDTEDVGEVDDDDNIDGIEDVDDVGYESQNLCVQSPCRAVNCLH